MIKQKNSFQSVQNDQIYRQVVTKKRRQVELPLAFRCWAWIVGTFLYSTVAQRWLVCVCFNLSLARKILCRGHELLSRGDKSLSCCHEIIKWCAQDIMSWPRVTMPWPRVYSRGYGIIKWCARDTISWPRVSMSWPRDNKVVRRRYYVMVISYQVVATR
jgi:hypothetical protein